MRRKMARRDQHGRPYLDHARADDEDVRDGRDVLGSGEQLHIPMYLKDSADAWREDMHRHLSVGGVNTLVINTSAPLMVVVYSAAPTASTVPRALPRGWS